MVEQSDSRHESTVVLGESVRAIVDVLGVGGGVVDRVAELELPVTPTALTRQGGPDGCGKSCRREHHWGLADEGLVTA
jgi:hypothetical protein